MTKRLLAMLLVGLCVSACSSTPTTPTPTPASPTPGASATRSISLSGNLAFGTVFVGGSSSQVLTIGNVGTGTMTVSSITAPAGFAFSWMSGTIAAGGSQPVTVTFSPMSTTDSYAGSVTVAADQTSGTNTMAVSGAGATPVYTLTGTVTSSATGAVIVGALVTVVGGPAAGQNVRTDAGGVYTFSVPFGQYQLAASANGFIGQLQPISLSTSVFTVTQGFALDRAASGGQ
jgi:hypothetical protein